MSNPCSLPHNNERINQWVTTSTTDADGVGHGDATSVQSSGRRATRPPPSRVKGRGKCKSRARIRTRDGWRHEPTWSMEWRRGPLRSAKIAKFMKECGKNSKSEEAPRRLRVNPLIEEDSAKLRRRILLLLMPFIPRRDSARPAVVGMEECAKLGGKKKGPDTHTGSGAKKEGGRKEGSPGITLPRRSATGRGRSPASLGHAPAAPSASVARQGRRRGGAQTAYPAPTPPRLWEWVQDAVRGRIPIFCIIALVPPQLPSFSLFHDTMGARAEPPDSRVQLDMRQCGEL